MLRIEQTEGPENAVSIGALCERAALVIEWSFHGYVQAGAAIVDTAAIANESIYLSRHWTEMSDEQRAQSLLSMGFWAAGTGAAIRTGGLRPGDMFNPNAVRDGLLRNFAPRVTPDGSLQGNAVRIDYDPATGAVQGIRHGPQATAADIDLHVATAQTIQRSLTLEGQLGTFFAGHGEPRAGTVGWASRIDISKIRERMEIRSRELVDPGLTAQRRADIVRENALDQQHLDQLAEDVSSFVRDPSRAAIEARNTRGQPGERARIVLDPGNKADGWNQTLNGELAHNTDYVVGRYTYTTDEAGRVVEAKGRVRLNRHDRNTHQQGKAAEVGGIKDAIEGDQGGHLFAAMFDGPGEQINYHPMTRELNGSGGDWYNMEQEWRSALEQNRTVDAQIRAEFDGDSKRPVAFRVTFWIDGKKHTRFFENTTE
ncbi:DNA/RNA non-specific endonuclease [Bradyrhizobium sp. sBnM-33]|uniref:DNA/RNA non-specific endonuclease n=1 Tax=Bradyrhizobium sp. sBnM-33 TaxID=2831780 RepID=UPI001BCA97E4|nr:DNA/RNA non-specific endonuclease [Bradyrhizobium sp. sBnM-33]WOH53611.1 DNA/RNA non-specific endonuclease [Bradyrhizobium sp. sBnM-33]